MLEPTEALRRILAGEELSRVESEELVGRLVDGEVPEALQAGLLVGLAARGETVEEIAGAAAAMRRRVVAVPHHRQAVVDTCGTGGDAAGTFNISTAAALVAAGAGVPVAKHGNRSVSSRSGSADVLAALGVAIETEPERAGRCLDEVGIAFLFAPRLHPAMRAVMPVRRALGVRTLFNVLGPLTNPAGAPRQVVGVYAADLVERVAGVLAELGSEHALVVHGADGLDEITTTGPTRVAEVRNATIRAYTLDPAALGLAAAAPEELRGGGPERNAELMLEVLEGSDGALAEITVLNAAAAIYVGGRAADLQEGIEAARDALLSGAALDKLAALREFCRE